MRDGGRVAATLSVLEDFAARRVPLKVCLADWARGARYAGSKDRAFIAGLALDVLRQQESLLVRGEGMRGAVALTLNERFAWSEERIAAAFAEAPHGPGALTAAEHERFGAAPAGAVDAPDFTIPLFAQMTDHPAAEISAYGERAPIDLRVNTLKADLEKVLKALAGYGAEPSPLAADGLRIPAPPAAEKAPAITITPAFQKGWVEVQDEASQIAAMAAGSVEGAQVLDFCAGGGGKTLALAALMDNTGQLFAYDADARRLAPSFERLARAGVRNTQIISPAEDASRLNDLKDAMDVVFVDAPCSGAGTWRRHPDTKWRLTSQHLGDRQAEQRAVIDEAATYVRPGGALVYVTCSPFMVENEDIVAAFLSRSGAFTLGDVSGAIGNTARLRAGVELPPASDGGTVRLGPRSTGTDGFAITRLVRNGVKTV